MSRNTHPLDGHRGDLEATGVELSEAIDTLPQGSTLEETLEAIHDRLLVLEDEGTYRKRFTIDAQIVN